MTKNPLPDYLPASEYMEMSREEAFEKYKKIADSQPENFVAQCIVGYCYSKEAGTKKDVEKAKSYFKKAADKNFAPALNSLGTLQESPEEAFNLYEKSASQNYLNGLYNLARAYMNGNGCEKSLKNAEEILLKIRDLHIDEPDIYTALAGFYSEYCDESEKQVAPYYISAAEKGDLNAMFQLWFRVYVKYSDEDDEENGPNRAKWYRRYHEARIKTHSERCKIAGEQLPYLLKRAEKGELYAVMELINYYKDFIGFHTNRLKAYEWEKKAAELGDVQSCFSVSEAFAKGSYEPVNFVKAVSFYNKGMELASGNEKKYYISNKIKELTFTRLKVSGFVNRYTKSKDKYAPTYGYLSEDEVSSVTNEAALAFCEKYAGKDKDFALAVAFHKYLNESEKSAADYLKSHNLEDAVGFLDYTDDEVDPNSKVGQAFFAMKERDRKSKLESLEETVKENPRNGKSWYELAGLYKFQDDLESQKKAFEYFTKSAENSYAEAFYDLAYIYKNGTLFDSDVQKASDAYEKGADLGSAPCLLCKAEMLRDGTYFDREKGEFVQDFEAAIACLKKALAVSPGYHQAKFELENYNIKVAGSGYSWLSRSRKSRNVKPFDWESWTFGDFEFSDDEKIPEYKEDEGYWKNTKKVECSAAVYADNYFEDIVDSLKTGSAYRLVFDEELDEDSFDSLYEYFSDSEHAASLTLDLDLRKCRVENGYLPAHSLCGKFRNLYLPDSVGSLADDSLDVYAEKIVFGSRLKRFSNPVNSREIGLLDFSLIDGENFTWRIAYGISQLKVNYMREIPVKSNYEFYTVEDRHTLEIMKDLRNTLESNPDKKYVVDFTHSVYAEDPETEEEVPLPKNFLAKQDNLYFLFLGNCDGVELPENFCRECKNLQTVVMWDFDDAGEGAFKGVNRNCTIADRSGKEILVRMLY